MSQFVSALENFIGSSDNGPLNYVVTAVFGLFVLKQLCSFLGAIGSSLSSDR